MSAFRALEHLYGDGEHLQHLCSAGVAFSDEGCHQGAAAVPRYHSRSQAKISLTIFATTGGLGGKWISL